MTFAERTERNFRKDDHSRDRGQQLGRPMPVAENDGQPSPKRWRSTSLYCTMNKCDLNIHVGLRPKFRLELFVKQVQILLIAKDPARQISDKVGCMLAQ